MSRNGERHPPRPSVQLVTPAASESEAAAIVAAVEQFLSETSPAPAAPAGAQSRWQRAALEEGVSARSDLGTAWGGLRA